MGKKDAAKATGKKAPTAYAPREFDYAAFQRQVCFTQL
jgi:hypothetical protein